MPTLYLWVVYDNPSDFPGFFVARKFAIINGREVPTAERLLERDIHAIRRALPRGLCPIKRHPSDDPVIVETWV